MNNSALQRLAYKADATRISSSAYDLIREVGIKYLESLVNYAQIHADYEKKKTISGDHAVRAINNGGFSDHYKISDPLKPCKISQKKTLSAQIREYKNQYDCNTLSKAPIEQNIKSLSKGFKWSKEAIQNIHSALEYFLFKVFFSAQKITLNAKRKTLSSNDVELTVQLIYQNCKSVKLQLR